MSKDVLFKVTYNIDINELSELPDYGSNHFEVDYKKGSERRQPEAIVITTTE